VRLLDSAATNLHINLFQTVIINYHMPCGLIQYCDIYIGVRGHGVVPNHHNPPIVCGQCGHCNAVQNCRSCEQKAKELDDAPKPKLTTEFNVVTWKRITNLATKFAQNRYRLMEVKHQRLARRKVIKTLLNSVYFLY
jgi:hypothetical protein